MTIEEIQKTFGEIRELRKKAQDKEDGLIEALVSDGQLSSIEAILVKTPGFGGDKMTEAFVMSVLSKKENPQTNRFMTREEAIKEMREKLPWLTEDTKRLVEALAPELKESEDEKDRQHIIRILDDCYAYGKHDLSKTDHENLLAWLEKQKEEEEDGYEAIPIESTLEYKAGKHAGFLEGLKEGRKQKEQKPIFRVGDILKKKGKEYTFTVDKIQGGFYLTQDEHFFPIEEQDTWELVEQKEQKPVEFPLKDKVFSIMKKLNSLNFMLKLGSNEEKLVNEITSEVRDLADYSIDKPAEWDEYTKTNLDRALQIIKKAKGTLQGYQSDDGIYECDKAIECLEHFLYRGLEIEKHAEWSEEDEHRITDAIYFLETAKSHYADTSELDTTINFLKSLRPQYHGDVTMTEAYKMGLEAGKALSWKPSEEQIGALNEVINTLAASKHPHESDYLFNMLNGLRKDLKKL